MQRKWIPAGNHLLICTSLGFFPLGERHWIKRRGRTLTNKQQRTSEGQNLRTSNADKTRKQRKEGEGHKHTGAYVQLLGASLLFLLCLNARAVSADQSFEIRFQIILLHSVSNAKKLKKQVDTNRLTDTDTDLSSQYHRRLTITANTLLHCQHKNMLTHQLSSDHVFCSVFVLLDIHYCYKWVFVCVVDLWFSWTPLRLVMVSSRFCRRSRTFCTVLFLWDSGSVRMQNHTLNYLISTMLKDNYKILLGRHQVGLY